MVELTGVREIQKPPGKYIGNPILPTICHIYLFLGGTYIEHPWRAGRHCARQWAYGDANPRKFSQDLVGEAEKWQLHYPMHSTRMLQVL